MQYIPNGTFCVCIIYSSFSLFLRGRGWGIWTEKQWVAWKGSGPNLNSTGANWSNWLQRDLTYIELIDENEGVTALISATISWKVPSSLIAMAYTSISWKEAVGVMFG